MNALTMRRMTRADLHQVVLLDWMSFSLPWPISAFEHELTNDKARCWVADAALDASLEYHSPIPVHLEDVTVPAGQRAVVGALVMWLILDEAHIATIATHPQLRRRGIAEVLLRTAFDAAVNEGARLFYLEVRTSNLAAQRLYEKFGFEVTGRRKGYYKNNGEDAILMTLAHLNGSAR
jgi:[ribosomal protein S18]-alanine N-acetyltransferase